MSIEERAGISPALRENPVVAVLRAHHAKEYFPVVESLVRGGVRSIELTLSTDGVFDYLAQLLDAFAPEAEIGVGTITDKDQAELALDQGARFLVTPTMNTDVVAAGATRNVPVFPGGLTPTELLSGWTAGATAVKLFPASTVDPQYIKQLRGPFPDIEILPSGGIDLADVADWIHAGAIAVSLGGPLVQDAFKGGDLDQLSKRARQASTSAAEAMRFRDKL